MFRTCGDRRKTEFLKSSGASGRNPDHPLWHATKPQAVSPRASDDPMTQGLLRIVSLGGCIVQLLSVSFRPLCCRTAKRLHFGHSADRRHTPEADIESCGVMTHTLNKIASGTPGAVHHTSHSDPFAGCVSARSLTPPSASNVDPRRPEEK